MSEKTAPLVTIGIPTYNRASANLADTINRALNQTYQNIEVIVSDNCSSDNTPELLASFNDPRLHYHRQETNIGANNNFNFLVQKATGKYFLLYHDDDAIDPDFIETCMKHLDHNQETGIIHTGVRIIDANDAVLAEYPVKCHCHSFEDFVMGWFEGKFALFLCSTLFNTEALQGIKGFHSPHNLYQDIVAEMQLAASLGSTQVPEVKASFRRHDANFGGNSRLDDWIDDSLFILKLIEELATSPPEGFMWRGQKFQCRLNYNRANNASGVITRLRNYYKVAKAFNFAFSPAKYAWQLDIKPRLLGRKKLAH